MRDIVESQVVLEHPPRRVWQVIGVPELYPRFVREISWCERTENTDDAGDTPIGEMPRYLLRMTPDEDRVVEDEIEATQSRPDELVVWSSLGFPGRWVALELRPLPGERTELNVQVMFAASRERPAPISAHALRRRIKEIMARLVDHLAGVPEWPLPAAGAEPGMPALAVAQVMRRAGVLAAGRPDRLLRQVRSLTRWGATVVGGYQAAAAREPDRIAVRDEQSVRSFAEIQLRSARLANALADRGVRPGSRAMLMCRNHTAMVECMVACGRLGADAVLLNTGLSATAVAEVVAGHTPSIMLVDDEFAPLIEHLPGRFGRISTWPEDAAGYPSVDELIRDAPEADLEPAQRPGRIVVLTSGTTGAPKGAKRPTPRSLNIAATLLDRIPLRVGERMLVAAPLFHTWGLAGLQLGMPLRATLTLRRRFDAEETLRAIAEDRCTALIAVPIMLQRIMDLPAEVRARYDTTSLRVVASSGAALPGRLVTAFMDAFGDILYNLYGSTEVSWASIADPRDLRAAPTTAGRFPAGTTVGILDPRGDPVPPGVDGNIHVRNEMLFDGYTDGGSLPRAHRLMATGDRGYLDADERLFVSGRADEMIVSGGENVFPRPVEEALCALPEVADAAVIGVPDAEFGRRLAAYVVLEPGARLDADSVRAHIHQRVARFAVPRDVYFVPDLPRNATGKVLKRLLHDETWTALSPSTTDFARRGDTGPRRPE